MMIIMAASPRTKHHHHPLSTHQSFPPYFFCPITKMIMKDPVITPDGHTFERRAILRFLILQPVDPITKNALSHEELVEDYLVKQAIDKARKEAWIRYVVEFKDEDVDRIIEQHRIIGESGGDNNSTTRFLKGARMTKVPMTMENLMCQYNTPQNLNNTR